MKYLPLVFALLLYAIPQCQNTGFAGNTKSSNSSLAIIDAAGGDGIGEGGSIAFSVGQVFYNEDMNQDFSIREGVQQPIPVNKSQPLALPKTQIKISTYPNPVDDFFIIETSDLKDKNISYKLLDLSGKLIVQDNLEKTRTRVNAYNLQAALYLLYLVEDGRHMKTLKILKR
ncbi:putative secreted protein (Por secretion system target) [Gillisia sp. Hel_I_86]|uniref:T9SS type A sorting domain-containing protein n=1 Tax=Gillisia sp. Hel_I_86 TaxID=1249981 RepID=UPI001198CD77|nr:T9SS type A sorting domain-containing protein [Gillisia sp. Hel_I_86]TVZ27534.1 putative secreted protein (Por secretion system target) [Gillisia sp. Hel_I_86]